MKIGVFLKGWVTLRASFRKMRTSPAIHLWTIRQRNDVATTLPLEVHTKKLCSRLFSREVEFYWQKQQNRVLCHPLEDLGATYVVHLWLVGKRVVDFLLVLIELFSLAITVEAL